MYRKANRTQQVHVHYSHRKRLSLTSGYCIMCVQYVHYDAQTDAQTDSLPRDIVHMSAAIKDAFALVFGLLWFA